MARLQNQKLLTTGHSSQKEMACSVNVYLDLEKTGNATVESIKELDTKVLSAINVV